MQQQLASVFAALGDPTRLAIVQRLAEGEASVQELAEPFDISRSSNRQD
jgi:DNA-binding transcriptional ArsR family regulator